MSQPHLLTIDFLGIGSDDTATQNITSAMDCRRQVTKRRAMQSCLGKIKPHMLQQILSNGCLSIAELSHRELHCGVSEDLKTMELFPQHATGFQSNSKDSLSEAAAAAAVNFKLSTKPSSPQLTILYNGTINVYDNVSSDNAKAIMMMAAGDGNTPNVSDCLAFSRGLRECVFNPEESANGANQRHFLGVQHWKLPIAKKKSLGRFLQKRKARYLELLA